jgi:uncharacterized spore protein YtfJ
MALREFVGGMNEGSTVRRVFGDPIEKDGVLIVPVATLGGGVGGGEGPSAKAAGAADAEGKPAPMSWGGGGMWSAKPAGMYVLKNGEVSWVPAVDQNRTIFLSILTGLVSLLVLRSIVRTVVKRG